MDVISIQSYWPENQIPLQVADSLVPLYDLNIPDSDEDYRKRNFDPRSSSEKIRNLAQQWRLFIIAKVQDEVWGLLEYSIEERDRKFGFIYWIIAQEKVRNKGIAHKLHAEYLKKIKQASCTWTALGVRPDNTLAKSWYERLWYTYWMEDKWTIFLSKDLSLNS